MAAATKAQKGSGRRRKFKGKMVQPGGSPRSHTHGGGRPAAAGFEVGSTAMQAVPTKNLAGRFKVGPPTKRAQRRGFYRPISA